MDNFVNMTPHDVNLYVKSMDEDGNEFDELVVAFKKTGQLLRAPNLVNEPTGLQVGGREENGDDTYFEVCRKVYTEGVSVVIDADGNQTALPEPVEGTYYIVSRPAAENVDPARSTSDLLMVDGVVTDEDNRRIGCRGFVTL